MKTLPKMDSSEELDEQIQAGIKLSELCKADVVRQALDELDLLSLVVHDYEEKQFPIKKPDPVAAIRFRMEQQGLARKDLIPFLGSRSRVSEVLSGRRGLSLKMIRALAAGLRIPAELLLGETGRT
jgi:HTH-type transcriptional regulator / antitoxin HigA